MIFLIVCTIYHVNKITFAPFKSIIALLYLKKSTIPGAGLGLFTDDPIAKGKKIVEYLGEIVSWAVCEKRAIENKGGYVFHINDNYCIDGYDYTEEYARYANDAAGLVRVKGIKNNSNYQEFGKRVFIVSTRNIKPGEEIFVSYGRGYWNVVKEIRKPRKGKNNIPKARKA